MKRKNFTNARDGCLKTKILIKHLQQKNLFAEEKNNENLLLDCVTSNIRSIYVHNFIKKS